LNGQQLAKHWHDIVKINTAEVIAPALHEDCVFESPVVHTPQLGRAISTQYLVGAAHVLGNGNFEYVGEWYSENSCVLEFRTEINGIAVNGADFITCDGDGLITHFKVMIRPLKAINMVHAMMGEMLQKLGA